MLRSLDRGGMTARVFCLAAVFGLILISREGEAILSLALVAAIAVLAIYVSTVTPLSPAVVAAAEAGLVGLIIGLALPSGVLLLPYLVVLSLIAGVSRGVIGVSTVTVTEIVTVGFFSATVVAPTARETAYQTLAPWLVTSIVAGLVGAWLRGTSRVVNAADTARYESARRLLSQLRTISRHLSSGLDLPNLATQTLATVSLHANTEVAAVLLRSQGGLLAPAAYTDEAARNVLSPNDPVAHDCWAHMEPVWARKSECVREGDAIRVAWPLRVGSRMLGVVLADVNGHPSQSAMSTIMEQLDEQSLRLDAGMTFDEIRSTATAEERRRLAREIHDGLAQEVASLGYVVDELVASAESQRQKTELQGLRMELTRVVNELRLSIFDLRSEINATSGLGAALSDHVRQIGARTDLTVHLTLDEAPTRLRMEVEAELLRIAGEAIANARKHADATSLWVDCRVDPPFACLEIRDDGSGMRPGREDSFGLRIMRERVERIDGRLEILSANAGSPRPGTTVRVMVGEPPPSTDELTKNGNHGDSVVLHGSVSRRS